MAPTVKALRAFLRPLPTGEASISVVLPTVSSSIVIRAPASPAGSLAAFDERIMLIKLLSAVEHLLLVTTASVARAPLESPAFSGRMGLPAVGAVGLGADVESGCLGRVELGGWP